MEPFYIHIQLIWIMVLIKYIFMMKVDIHVILTQNLLLEKNIKEKRKIYTISKIFISS